MMVWSQVARARHPQRLLSVSGGAKEKNSFHHTEKVEINGAVGILYCMVLHCTTKHCIVVVNCIVLYCTVLKCMVAVGISYCMVLYSTL